MTTGHESLAAQLTASIFGPATGDPFQDAMREAAMAGAARLGEMGQTGFDTNTPFDNLNQAQYVGEGRVPFLLVSLVTNTTYFVLVTKVVDKGLQVAIAVHHEGQTPKVEHLRKMTLVRNTDGNVRAVAGW
jgi:hypothetical protein